MDSTHNKQPSYPFSVVRFLQNLKPRLRNEVYRHLDEIILEQGVEDLTVTHLSSAIARAYEMRRADVQRPVDITVVERARADYENGHWEDIDAIIAELQDTRS